MNAEFISLADRHNVAVIQRWMLNNPGIMLEHTIDGVAWRINADYRNVKLDGYAEMTTMHLYRLVKFADEELRRGLNAPEFYGYLADH